MSIAELVATYIRAKDSNRAYLMNAAFAPEATLDMVVNTGTISFPPHVSGRDAIADVLVRRFGQTFENVYTFCLCPPPDRDAPTFSCAWLVGMSEKDGGAVRVGCGQYHWTFRDDSPRQVERLRITIDHMHVLSPSHLSTVMNWLSHLPYPWCPRKAVLQTAPRLDDLRWLLEGLEEMEREDAQEHVGGGP